LGADAGVKNPIFPKNRIFWVPPLGLKIRFFQKIGFFWVPPPGLKIRFFQKIGFFCADAGVKKDSCVGTRKQRSLH
jgi:hypothetical protein